MNNFEITSSGPEDTINFAERLSAHLKAGDVITLEGDLGAGKTTFTKGIAKGLNISRTVNSPTFTIVKEYEGDLPLYHIDAYRLEDSDEDLGFEEYFTGDGITVVEWAVFIQDFLPTERLEISIRNVDESKRVIELRPIGDRFEYICGELME
jgi:tRNA threonylcarbamoyladenosine biosynthesis protein TsaE